MLEKLSDKSILFEYGDEKLTLCCCDDDGRIDDAGPMPYATNHWLDKRCILDKEQWRELEDHIRKHGGKIKAFYGDDVYNVHAKAEGELYVGIELERD